jgi:hypothetical protein
MWAWEDRCAAISCVPFKLPRTDPKLRLTSLDPVASRQGWNRAGRMQAAPDVRGSLAPRKKARVNGQSGDRNQSEIGRPQRELNLVKCRAMRWNQTGFPQQRPLAPVAKTPAKTVDRDEPLTRGASDMQLLDLRDALMAGARALLEDEYAMAWSERSSRVSWNVPRGKWSA